MLLFKIIWFGILLLFGILIHGKIKNSVDIKKIAIVDFHFKGNSGNDDAANTTQPAEKCSIAVWITKDWGEVETTNYPKPYPVNCAFTYGIHIGSDHKLKLTIRDLDVDIESGDAVIIESSRYLLIWPWAWKSYFNIKCSL